MPEKVTNFGLELFVLAILAKIAQTIELSQAQLVGNLRSDFLEKEFNLRLLQVVAVLTNYLQNFRLVVALCQRPEKFKKTLVKAVLLQKKLKDLSRSLYKLSVGLSCIP
jgi:predicted DNA-binding ribbon-helix-helix protein